MEFREFVAASRAEGTSHVPVGIDRVAKPSAGDSQDLKVGTGVALTVIMNLKRRSPGFTLVEIMIVVAIIALLAVIAIPNFLRARKRAQATRMVDDLRLIDNALDRYACDYSKGGGAPASWLDLQPYLKKNIVLYNSNGIDLFGNPINDGPVFLIDSVPKVNSISFSSLSDVAPREFWVPYDP